MPQFGGNPSEAGKKGAASRRKKYHYFAELKKKNPEQLKEISAKAGKLGKRGPAKEVDDV